ncbi:hypothetical protein EGM92_28560, partial [Enterobacter cloacae]
MVSWVFATSRRSIKSSSLIRAAEGEYPTKSRGTQGVISIKVTERNGSVVGAVQVDDADQI